MERHQQGVEGGGDVPISVGYPVDADADGDTCMPFKTVTTQQIVYACRIVHQGGVAPQRILFAERDDALLCAMAINEFYSTMFGPCGYCCYGSGYYSLPWDYVTRHIVTTDGDVLYAVDGTGAWKVSVTKSKIRAFEDWKKTHGLVLMRQQNTTSMRERAAAGEALVKALGLYVEGERFRIALRSESCAASFVNCLMACVGCCCWPYSLSTANCGCCMCCDCCCQIV